MTSGSYRAVVMGASSGGLEALAAVLCALDKDFPLPVAVVQHLGPEPDSYLARHLDAKCALHVKEADEKELLAPGTVHIAPPNYHLLVEQDGTLSLSVDKRVCYARPSVDVLFESAAVAFGGALVGVVLTGGNEDGRDGIAAIRRAGGLAVAQDPEDAAAPAMPRAAITGPGVDHVLPLSGIGPFLNRLVRDHD